MFKFKGKLARIQIDRVLFRKSELSGNLKHLGVYGRIIINRILKLYWEGMKLIYLVQEREKCLNILYMVMNIRVP
jgi:hypothetical protein